MDVNSPQFQQFIKHILGFEGGLSKDPKDTAVQYAPFVGAYHTNKGVTFGTFKTLGSRLGISPITYEKFVKLTDQEVGKFIYEFYRQVHGNDLPGTVGLSVAEAAWGSGVKRAITQLQQALVSLGAMPATNPKTKASNVDGRWGPTTLAAVKKVKEKPLYDAFWKIRKSFIDKLKVTPGYTQYANGWTRRYTEFLNNIKPDATTIGVGAIMLLAGAAYYFLAKKPINI